MLGRYAFAIRVGSRDGTCQRGGHQRLARSCPLPAKSSAPSMKSNRYRRYPAGKIAFLSLEMHSPSTQMPDVNVLLTKQQNSRDTRVAHCVSSSRFRVRRPRRQFLVLSPATAAVVHEAKSPAHGWCERGLLIRALGVFLDALRCWVRVVATAEEGSRHRGYL